MGSEISIVGSGNNPPQATDVCHLVSVKKFCKSLGRDKPIRGAPRGSYITRKRRASTDLEELDTQSHGEATTESQMKADGKSKDDAKLAMKPEAAVAARGGARGAASSSSDARPHARVQGAVWAESASSSSAAPASSSSSASSSGTTSAARGAAAALAAAAAIMNAAPHAAVDEHKHAHHHQHELHMVEDSDDEYGKKRGVSWRGYCAECRKNKKNSRTSFACGKCSTSEKLVYLCPTGSCLADHLSQFWKITFTPK